MFNLQLKLYNPFPRTVTPVVIKDWKWVIINYKMFRMKLEKLPTTQTLFGIVFDSYFWGNSWTGILLSFTFMCYKTEVSFSDIRTWDYLNSTWRTNV